MTIEQRGKAADIALGLVALASTPTHAHMVELTVDGAPAVCVSAIGQGNVDGERWIAKTCDL